MSLRRRASALVPMLGIGAAAIASRPLGPLAGTMLLIVTLPPLAASLDALGWATIIAGRVRRAGLSASRELVGAYATWLALSATLTLDIGAVIAVPVGLGIAAGRAERSGRDHLGAAILGANVGSLLFPFSNLTNLVLVSATGMSFAAYVGAAWLPQVLAALGAGALLILRTHPRRVSRPPSTDEVIPTPSAAAGPEGATRLALVGGVVVAAGAISAVILGFAGADVAPVFALASALVTGCAVASGRPGTRPFDLARSIPLRGVAIVGIAALAIGPMRGLAGSLPDPQTALPTAAALPIIALVGGLLALTVNNLPAAAFGAFWLVGASPDAVVAFLIGTNLLAMATPHGSLATILCQRLAEQRGIHVGTRSYVSAAWRYATAAGLPAIGALLVAGR